MSKSVRSQTENRSGTFEYKILSVIIGKAQRDESQAATLDTKIKWGDRASEKNVVWTCELDKSFYARKTTTTSATGKIARLNLPKRISSEL